MSSDERHAIIHLLKSYRRTRGLIRDRSGRVVDRSKEIGQLMRELKGER